MTILSAPKSPYSGKFIHGRYVRTGRVGLAEGVNKDEVVEQTEVVDKVEVITNGEMMQKMEAETKAELVNKEVNMWM